MSQFQTSLLDNKYEIIRQLGKGNMGSVYLVRRKADGKELVVKKLIFSSGTGLNKEDTKELFEREINFLSRFNHRGLPQIHGTFREDEEDYLLLEYIKGETLEDILSGKNGALPVEKAIKWTIEIAEILDYLHNSFEAPIIYKDLKPSNIIITPGGKPRLIDFGTSRYYDPEKISDTHRLGTPGYAAPEQYKGRTSAQSDVFSLGVILYEMLTGYDPTVTPLKFPDMVLLNPLISEELEYIIKNAIEKDHFKRCISVMELKENLEKYMGIKKPEALPDYLVSNVSYSGRVSLLDFFRDFKKKPLTSPVWGVFNYISFAVFVRQFALMINGGFSVPSCFYVSAGDSEDKKLGTALVKLTKTLESSLSFSSAISQLSKLFSPLFISLIRAGEVREQLGDVLNRFSLFLDTDTGLERKVRWVKTCFLIAPAMAIIIFQFISPTFVDLLEGMDLTLTIYTKILIKFINTFRNPFIIMPVIYFIILIAIIFKIYVKTRSGRRWYDKFKCSVPLFGSTNKKLAVSRFCRILALLIMSKVPAAEALDIAGKSCRNEFIAQKVGEKTKTMDKGENIASPLASIEFFPPMVIQMIKAGEKNGNLPEVLYKVSDTYNKELEFILKGLIKILNHIVVIEFFILIGVVIISMNMPITIGIGTIK